METSKEIFVENLQEYGLKMIRIREPTEYCRGALEIVSGDGTIFLVGADWFDVGGCVDESYTKPFEEVEKLRRERNRLNREISSLKKAQLNK